MAETIPSLESLAADLAGLRNELRRLQNDFVRFVEIARRRLHRLEDSQPGGNDFIFRFDHISGMQSRQMSLILETMREQRAIRKRLAALEDEARKPAPVYPVSRPAPLPEAARSGDETISQAVARIIPFDSLRAGEE